VKEAGSEAKEVAWVGYGSENFDCRSVLPLGKTHSLILRGFTRCEPLHHERSLAQARRRRELK
jgi:hypothetical protein